VHNEAVNAFMNYYRSNKPINFPMDISVWPKLADGSVWWEHVQSFELSAIHPLGLWTFGFHLCG
jgi:hypothetical protein